MIRIVLNITIVVLCIACLIVGLVFIGPDSTDCTNVAEVPTSISVSNTGQYSIISWQIPEGNQDCEVTYTLRYSIDGGDGIVINTADSYYSIAHLEACSDLSLNLWVVDESGKQSNRNLTYDYNYTPTSSNIPSPNNLEVSNVTEGLEVNWSTPEGLDRCTVSFHITIVAHLNIYSNDTSEESYIITEEQYCFNTVVTVATVVNGVTGSSTTLTYEDKEPVTGVEYIISPEDSTKLIVSWVEHPKEESCSLEYRAVYSIEDEVVETVTTPDHTATFNITYCVDASVSITAHRLFIFSSDEATIDVTECNER